MKWVTSKDLAFWASRRDCQETLPQLIRKLIRANSTSIKKIRFPSGDNVHLTGWDGVLESMEESEFIPTGISLWEIGSNSDFKVKANKDYEKRTKDTKGYDPLSSTFVFVTPHIWNDKDIWIQSKIAEGQWQEIRVIDGENLEEWLEVSPTVSCWLATRHLNIYPTENIQSLDDFWEEWSVSPNLILSKDILLGGREREVKKLIDRLQGSPQIIPVQSSSREESLAFIIASFKNDQDLLEDLFSKSLIVDTIDSFRKIATLKKSLILISRVEDNAVVNKAVRDGMHVLVPMGLDASKSWENVLILPRIDRNRFIQSLMISGIKRDLAEKYSKESVRNISILRRQLKFDRSIPQWAKVESVRNIIPALLIGKWNEDIEQDRIIISQLANEPYEQYIQKLSLWLNTQDAPILKIGNLWRLSAPLDAWTQCAYSITKYDLELFEKVAHTILTEVDPIFNVEPNERHPFSKSNINRLYSSKIRKGIAQSLIIIAVFGDSLKIFIPVTSQQFVDALIRKLLNNKNRFLWRTLDDVHPLIAEAAPDVFLDIVDKFSIVEDSPILDLFIEEEGFFETLSYHTGLLWALERIAWMKTNLTKTTVLLGRLAENDHGKHLSNRPINSLTEIFKAWHPQTFADINDRIDALDKLLLSFPRICLQLLFRLLPHGRGSASPTNQFRWRFFDESFERPITYAEIYQFHTKILDLIIRNVSENEEDFALLANITSDLQVTDRETVLRYLSKNHGKIPKSKNLVWNEFRKILGRHRTYPDADWALPESELEKIEMVCLKFTPTTLIEKTLWMFNEYPEFIDGYPPKTPYLEREEKVRSARINGVKNIYQRFGIKKMIDVVNLITESKAFGQASGFVINNEKNVLLFLNLIKINDNHHRIITQSFLWQKSKLKGLSYGFKLIHQAHNQGFSNEELASLFLPLEFIKQVWDELEKYDGEIQAIYWKKVWVTFHWISGDDIQIAVRKLIEALRFPSIISEISLYIEKFSVETILEVLEKNARVKSEDPTRPQYSDVERLFEKLYTSEEIELPKIIQMEWAYLPILSNYGFGIKPKYLDSELAKNPEFFIEVLKWVYKTDSNEDEIVDESISDHDQNVMRARNAFDLLHNWKTIPGLDSENKIQYDVLNMWIEDIRKRSIECNRQKSADAEIGKILSVIPESEAAYPPKQLCEIIDKINSTELNTGFYLGVRDKRSFSSRGVFDGGQREWDLVKYFIELSNKTASLYPVTSSIFRMLSNSYSVEAKWEDDRATETDLEY